MKVYTTVKYNIAFTIWPKALYYLLHNVIIPTYLHTILPSQRFLHSLLKDGQSLSCCGILTFISISFLLKFLFGWVIATLLSLCMSFHPSISICKSIYICFSKVSSQPCYHAVIFKNVPPHTIIAIIKCHFRDQ